MPTVSRNALVAGAVVLFHVLALWALQTGLLRRAVEVVVPVELLSSLVTPPAPPAPRPAETVAPKVAEPPPQPVKRRPPPAPVPVPKPAAAPAPLPVAVADARPAPQAPVAVAEPQPAPAPVTAPVAAAPAPAPVQLPSSDAEYLQNPKPVYPAISRRLREQGRVIVSVLIGTDGSAHEVQLKQSSGYTRLDKSAMEAVRQWRYVPGKRGGVPEAMWFSVPITFVLD